MINCVIDRFEKKKKYILMFSGGIDSSIILFAGLKAGADITPVWIDNGFNRASESDIRKQAEVIGSDNFTVIKIKPHEKILSNTIDRCYLCKGNIIKSIKDKYGMDSVLIDGTNRSDGNFYRPGCRALKENSVQSFISDIDRDDVVQIAEFIKIDMTIASLESCIATRINYNCKITDDILNVIRNVEKFVIRETEDYDVRCRYDDIDHIRIEFSKPESYIKLSDELFRNEIIRLTENTAMFTTIDLKKSRPNEYDSRIEK